MAIALAITYAPASAQTAQGGTDIESRTAYAHLDAQLTDIQNQEQAIASLKSDLQGMRDSLQAFKLSPEDSNALQALRESLGSSAKGNVSRDYQVSVLERNWEADIQKLALLVERIDTSKYPIPTTHGLQIDLIGTLDAMRGRLMNATTELRQTLFAVPPDPAKLRKSIDDLGALLAEGKVTGPLLQIVNRYAAGLDESLTALKKQQTDIQTKASALAKDIENKEQGRTQIDKALVTFALPSFAALIVILFLAPRMYVDIAIQKTIVESGIVLQLITVFLLTATTLLLGVSGKIDGAILGTLLGGISGYVLGRTNLDMKKRQDDAPNRH